MRNPGCRRSEVSDQKNKTDGAAIMLALWALFLLSALVISWALDIDSRLAVSGEGTRMLKAEAAACSGAEIALNPVVTPGSANLHGRLRDGGSYEARLTGEGGRLDLNYFAAGPAGEAGADVLRRYLEIKGIDLNERDMMIDSLLDWVQPNAGLHRLNAPSESDDYHPAHAPLTRVDELKKVAGWQDFTSVPGWDNDFTVNSRTGVDLIWASRDVLLALGIMPDAVDRFLQLRQGPDGIDGTEDDTRFTNTEDVRAALGLTQEVFAKLQQTVLASPMPFPVFRVTSVGTAGKATRTVQMVFRRTGVTPLVVTWKEF